MTWSRGDTIIEVLLATAVFSLVSIGAMTIMTQGSNAAQRALEITLVRQQIDAQAEALRAAHQAATTPNSTSTAWTTITGLSESATHDSDERCPERVGELTNPLLMDGRTGTVATGGWLGNVGAQSHAKVDYTGTLRSYGMWIELDRQSGANNAPGAYDFTIRACWYGAGISKPMNLKTVVRLYDPS